MRRSKIVRAAGVAGVVAWALLGVSDVGARSDGTELVPPLVQANAQMGKGVAVSGDTALAGASHFDVDAPAEGGSPIHNAAGVVHVFRQSGLDQTQWPHEQMFFADTPQLDAHFGTSVGIDGDVAVVGAPEHDNGSPQLKSGAAYIFRRTGTSWGQETMLVPSDGAFGDQMGFSVAVSGDYAVVGAPSHNTILDAQQTQFGANGQVYVFRRVGNAWVESQILFASDLYDGQLFGTSVAIDGDRVIVGAPGAPGLDKRQVGKGPNPFGPGAYVFTRSGTTFQETCKVRPPAVGDFDLFGWSIDLDGSTFAVGAIDTPTDAVSNTFNGAGAVYVFTYDAMSDDWPLQQRMVSEQQTPNYAFGHSVGVSGDRLVAGSPGHSGDDFESGMVELFERTAGVWSQTDEFTRAVTDTSEHFGRVSAIDGLTCVVGAWEVDPGAGFNAGTAVVFAVSGNTPPPNTINAFVLPKSIKYVPAANGKKAPKPFIKVSAFFDSGPNAVDYTAPATLTIGSVDVALPGLTPDKKRRKFSYKGDGLKITITPSPLGSSKGRLKLTYTTPVPGDPNGEFTIRYLGGGIDALGKVRLENGKFVFGKKGGAILAPELDIRKAKANLPGRGRHEFKFVAGFTTDGDPEPTVAPDVTVAFGDLFKVVIPSGQFKLKNGKFTFKGDLDGIREVVLDYRKERLAVRGESVDLGDVPDGGQSLLLILTRDDDVRAVQVRAVRTKSKFQY